MDTYKKDLWNYLQEETSKGRKVVLYGTGDGADKIIARLEERNIPVSGIFASPGFVRNRKFHDIQVETFESLYERFGRDMIALMCFGSSRPEVLDYADYIADKCEFYAPDVPVYGQNLFDTKFCEKHAGEINIVRGLLADELSRKTFDCIINARLTGNPVYLKLCEVTQEEADAVLPTDRKGLFLDLGAYDGDTVREFQALCHGAYRAVYAFEPDPKNYAKLTAWAASYAAAHPGAGPVHCVPAAAGAAPGTVVFHAGGGRQSSLLDTGAGLAGGRRRRPKETELAVESVDHVLGTARLDYAKLDVEGVEAEALDGMRDHLTAGAAGQLPKLLIAAYHHDEDIFRLPLHLWRLQPAYRIWLRKHPYVPAWEINLFAR